MFRYRRYRVFLVFAVIAALTLYKSGFFSVGPWREAASNAVGPAGLHSDAERGPHDDTPPRPAVAHETRILKLDVPAASMSRSLQTPPPVKTPALSQQQKPSIPKPIRPQPHDQPAIMDNALEPSSTIDEIHWTKLPEQFPVAPESLIKLPSGTPKSMPKIQAKFKPEDATAKVDRIRKLDKIRDVAKKSWEGYKANAWLHDELRPQSGTFRDPFAHWGATLVDALDTLWIMGLKGEFEEAAKAVDEIDFTTTPRADIPMFETTIRYLGGLLAAYDLSEKKYKNLLDKAVELAEVLISAFDTPNRMPEMYYYWRPDFASQSHRASSRVVLAEIGSLSLEFTRLAQLTGEHKYYDAIARITDNLEEFQNKTQLPGMWPTLLDASGCRTQDIDSTDPELATPSPPEVLSPEGRKYMPLDLPDPIGLTQDDAPIDTGAKEDSIVPGTAGKAQIKKWDSNLMEKRQLDIDESELPKVVLNDQDASSAFDTKPTPPECTAQGFVSSSSVGQEEFTLGGMSDSTYEYLPKQYLLLGGQIEKYRTMYEQSMDVVKEHLVYRPMLPKGEDILFSGKLYAPSKIDAAKVGDLTAENAHLTCFAGGMFGMGAKLFDRPGDLEIAKKLTEGCVWSYNMTPTGIMPEAFYVIQCEDRKDCTWNQTAYWESIDPRYESRVETYKEQLKIYKEQIASASSWYEAELAAMTALPVSTVAAASEAQATSPLNYADTPDKRQLIEHVDNAEIAHTTSASASASQNHESVMGGESEEGEGPPTKVQPTLNIVELAPQPSLTLPSFPYVYSPPPILNQEDYVQNRIEEDRLPPGVTNVKFKSYILRPEAIESVWYMYRITGDSHWREAGWRMFLAINKHTATKFGNSAIDDVTQSAPELNDEMESFWLAETLKYFYLLFAEEDVISLDEWVLNTEAHPFKRPA